MIPENEILGFSEDLRTVSARRSNFWRFTEEVEEFFGKFTQCAGAVTDARFDLWGKFTEGFVVLHDLEERIVSKTVGPAAFGTDPAVAVIFRFRADIAVWIAQRDVANVACAAFFFRNAVKFLKEAVIVFLIIVFFSCESGGKDTRTSVEGFDFQTAVFADDPHFEHFCLFRGFQMRIFRERHAGLIHFDRFGILGKIADLETERSQKGDIRISK